MNQIFMFDKFAKEDGRIKKTGLYFGGIDEGFIGASFVKSFRYSANEEKLNRIGVRRFSAKLTRLNQVIQFYPYKTISLEVLQLRQRMLQLAPGFLTEPKYSMSENEDYLIYLARSDRSDEYQLAVEIWRKFEERALSLLAREKDFNRRDILLSILHRGRQLFIDPRGQYKISLSDLINQAERCCTHSTDLIEALSLVKEALYQAVPKNGLEHGELKTWIYKLIRPGSNGPTELTREFMDHLFRYDKDQVESLPYHKDPEILSSGRKIDAQYSPLLYKLIDRHVFGPFIFLTKQ